MNFCLAQARLAVPLAVAGAFHTDFMVGRAGDVETPSRYHDWDWWFGPFWTNMFYDFPDDWEYFIPTDFYIFQRD
jgi:hypothetical protein